MSKEFDLEVLLSVTTGIELTKRQRICDFLEYMTGARVSGINLDKICQLVRPTLTTQFPEISPQALALDIYELELLSAKAGYSDRLISVWIDDIIRTVGWRKKQLNPLTLIIAN